MLLELNLKQKAATFLGIILTGLISIFFLYQSPTTLALFLCYIGFLLTGNRPTGVYVFVVTLPRNLLAGYLFVGFNIKLMKWEWKNLTIAKMFDQTANKYPEKIAFQMDDTKITFRDAQQFTNKIGSYFLDKGYERGDSIALLMESRPEYAFVWVGLSKVGIVTALINHNLRKDILLHSIKASNAKAIIVGAELAAALMEINKNDIKGLEIFQYSDENQKQEAKFQNIADSVDLVQELAKHKANDLSDEIKMTKPKDKMVYIYTSGTTGLPKAAVITNLRYMFMATGMTHMLRVTSADTIYNPLPLHHTAGGILGVGSVLMVGTTMVIRRKFSASNYWTDCIKYNCTIAQYIGELCRYLLLAQHKPTDNQHSVKVMFGNGLKPQIWKQFVSRFEIPRIAEFYGSTEGNSNLINLDSHEGAIGFTPQLAKFFYPVGLIRCVEETGEPIRDQNGRCIACNAGEPGIFIGKINPKRAHSAFSGYADKVASEKKIIQNVFTEGDYYFNSGDILIQDILGYFYFMDRTGDTFRWRGENVSTTEVEAVISNVVGLQDCVVYGVEVPHVEGKAGMAAIVDTQNKIDIEQLSIGIRGSLPPYARPIFLRILPELEMTGTFKLKKRDLQNDGFNINKIKDKLYMMHMDGIYREFSENDFNDVQNGRARL